MSEAPPPPVAAFKGLCPRCGAKGLYSGIVTFAPRCRACGLDFSAFNVGDGPAALLILIVGGLVTALALIVELKFEPPWWLHVILWAPLLLVLVLLSLRFAKGMLLALEYRNRAREGRIFRSEMIRLPFIPTVIVAAAVAVMIGLGIWQLGRAQEKERLLADYSRAATLPPVDLDPLIAGGNVGTVPLAFRRALVTCRPGERKAEARAGRNREGMSGYSYWIACKPDAPGFAGRLFVNAGWSQNPAAEARLPEGTIAGTLGDVPADGPVVLTSAASAPPLVPAAAPSIEDIPNNHVSYAFQWFFFAAAAVVIYLLALRGRARKLPQEP